MSRVLSRYKVVLKVLFGASLVVWMVYSGKLNLSQVARSFSHWPLMLAIVGMGYFQVCTTAWRWGILLKAQQVVLPFRSVWDLTMIGLLFNLVIPGAVGGDLAKGYYVSRSAPGRVSHAAVSVLMDRVVGLLGLLTLGAVMAIANWREVFRGSATLSLAVLTIGAFLGVSIALCSAVIWGGSMGEWSNLPSVLQRMFQALHEYRQKVSVVITAIGLSVLNHTLSCAMYYVSLRAVGVTDIPMSLLFVVVPLGLVTTAIPISPAGIGVGQAAFFALFQLVAPSRASAAADAFTVFQLMFLVVCLSGLYSYVSYKHQANGADEAALVAETSR